MATLKHHLSRALDARRERMDKHLAEHKRKRELARTEAETAAIAARAARISGHGTNASSHPGGT